MSESNKLSHNERRIAVTKWSHLTHPHGERVDLLTEDFLRAFETPLAVQPGQKSALPGWSPATFVDNRRRLDGCQSVSALVLDYDDGDCLLEIAACWDRYFGVIHTTVSHTEESPRCRVILPLTCEISIDEFNTIYRIALARAADAGHSPDRSTCDASRYWFMPAAVDGIFQSIRLNGTLLDPHEVLSEFRHRSRDPRPSSRASSRDSTADLIARVAAARPATRNNTLNRISFIVAQRVAKGEVDKRTVESALYDAGLVCGLSDSEVRRTIASAFAGAARQAERQPIDPNAPDGRPVVRMRHGAFAQIVDDASACLATVEGIYERSGELVQVVALDQTDNVAPIRRDRDSIVIKRMTTSMIKKSLSQAAQWERFNAKSEQFVPADPRKDVVEAVRDGPVWPGVRPLVGVASAPFFRPDGSLVDEPGYDTATGIHYAPSPDLHVTLSNNLGRDDAREAAIRLLDVVAEFPFASLADQTVWLAALLSAVTHSAYGHLSGAPLFIFDGSMRGSGKSLLADAVGLIATGQRMPRSPYITDDNEMRKRILACCLAGDRVALIDNVPSGRAIGGAALDMVLTATTVRDRILGASQMVSVPHRSVWFATGNNISATGDTARRALKLRLEPNTASPESRSFQRSDLRGWIRKHRAALLHDALTIVAAYHQSGTPLQRKLPPLGSFEDWSKWVREPLVWLDLGDPAARLESRLTDSDPRAAAELELTRAWMELDPAEKGLTTSELCQRLAETRGRADCPIERIRAALGELVPTREGAPPEARRFSRLLRQLKGHWRHVPGSGDCAFAHAASNGKGGAKKWLVRVLAEDSGDSQDSPAESDSGGSVGSNGAQSPESPESTE